MRNNNLEQFIKLRRELTQEKEQLSRRLAQINEALGEISGASDAAPAAASGSSPAPAKTAAPAARGGASGVSLREHVIEVLRDGAKTKEEILAAVQQRGYRFQTNNPLNSLGVILYGKNPKLSRVDGRFSIGASAGSSSPGGRGKRQMSAAARERIAEAQRQRWAASRKSNPAAQPAAKNGSSSAVAKRRQISSAGRKAIAEAARKRWAAAKAAGKSRL